MKITMNTLSACLALGLMAYATPSLALKAVSGKVMRANDHTEVLVEFDGPLPANLGFFRVSSPSRQIVDFPVSLDNTTLPVEFDQNGRVTRAEVVQGQGRTRLVFQMASDYEIAKSQQGNTLKLIVRGPEPYRPMMSNPVALPKDSGIRAETAKTLGKEIALPVGPKLQRWQVLRQDDGTELIRLEFDRSDIQADARLNEDRLRVRFSRVGMNDGVPVSLKKDAALLAFGLTLSPGDQNLVLSLNLKGASHQIRQNGSQVDVVLAPLSKGREFNNPRVISAVSPEQSAVEMARGLVSSEKSMVTLDRANPTATKPKEKKAEGYAISRYSGRPISLSFKDADIRTVMQVFADFTRMNLVLSDKVQGKVTVYLTDVPWDQALDIVLKSRNLISTQSGNVLLVSTPEDVVNDQSNQAHVRARDDMEPLISKTFVVSYQKTADLVALIQSDKSKLLSSRGTLISDERTSQVFVEDTVSRVERIASVIQSLDKPVKQVMIEAKVVLADTTVAKDLGVKIRSASSPATEFTSLQTTYGKNGYVNTGGDAATNFAYTLFNAAGTRLINLQLKAYESETKVQTVSNPRVITSNKETALIEQGTEIPYQISTSSGATATEFKSANLKLEVTPQISPDGTILLSVDVAKDSVNDQVVTTGKAIDTRHVKTKVLVSDGGTVVLGGIFEDNNNDTKGKIPILGDIPLIGGLFRGLTSNHRKTELLIFLTPVIMEDM